MSKKIESTFPALCMASPNGTTDIPHKLRFSQKLRISLRKRWFGPKRRNGARRAVRCRYFGTDFIVNLEDAVGYEIAINRFERRAIEVMLDACRRLKPELFLDIGANLGVYTCVLAKHDVVPRIIAFEPDRANCSRMARNLKINKIADRIELHQAAVGAFAGNASLVPAGPADRGMSHVEIGEAEGGYPVPVLRLDDLLRMDGATIAAKIDVEGFELEVLMGAAQLFTRNRGFVQIEGGTRRIAGVIGELMAAFGWRLADRSGAELAFEKP